jgi:hypothetical protein
VPSRPEIIDDGRGSPPLAPRHLHPHAHVGQEDWVREFSQYDAGWLHTSHPATVETSAARTGTTSITPARLTTLLAAGVPVIQRDNAGAVVATQTLVRNRQLGVFYRDIAELANQLRDRELMGRLRDSVWRQRLDFTFDAHADDLVAFFRKVIARHPSRNCGTTALCETGQVLQW